MKPTMVSDGMNRPPQTGTTHVHQRVLQWCRAAFPFCFLFSRGFPLHSKTRCPFCPLGHCRSGLRMNRPNSQGLDSRSAILETSTKRMEAVAEAGGVGSFFAVPRRSPNPKQPKGFVSGKQFLARRKNGPVVFMAKWLAICRRQPRTRMESLQDFLESQNLPLTVGTAIFFRLKQFFVQLDSLPFKLVSSLPSPN